MLVYRYNGPARGYAINSVLIANMRKDKALLNAFTLAYQEYVL